MAQTIKKSASSATRTWSSKALDAARAFKGIKVAKTPAKLKGKKAAAIERAVRNDYLG